MPEHKTPQGYPSPSASDDPKEIERLFREAVSDAIAEAHAAGLSVFQIEDGYMVAVQPDGKRRKLYRLRGLAGKRPSATAAVARGA